jgi:uncharacterized protein (TIGR02246 family)
VKKALILSLVLVSGCATAPPADDSAAINDLLTRWQTALRKGDARAVANLVTEDAEFWSASAAPIIGRAAVRQRYADFFGQYSLDQRFNVTERVIGGDHAILRGIEVNSLTVKANNSPLQVEQRAMTVLRRDRDGRWRIARGMTNFTSQTTAVTQ